MAARRSTAQSDESITLNVEDPFEKVVYEMVKLNRLKRADYAGDDHPWQNFYDSAYQLGLSGGHSVETLIATKQARLRVLLPRFWKKIGKPKNEGIRDSLLDRAVYSTIAVSIFDEGEYELGTEATA